MNWVSYFYQFYASIVYAAYLCTYTYACCEFSRYRLTAIFCQRQDQCNSNIWELYYLEFECSLLFITTPKLTNQYYNIPSQSSQPTYTQSQLWNTNPVTMLWTPLATSRQLKSMLVRAESVRMNVVSAIPNIAATNLYIMCFPSSSTPLFTTHISLKRGFHYNFNFLHVFLREAII